MSSSQPASGARKDTHPYENQILGAFMVGVGISLIRSGSSSVSTSMTQQTPLDTDCNDLTVGAVGFIAIEFKRKGNNRDRASEKDKIKNFTELKLDQQWHSMLDSSKNMHFVAYYIKTESDAGIKLEPYLHWIDQIPREKPPESAQTLIDALFHQKHWNHSREDLAAYLKWLRTHKKRQGAAARVDETYSMVVATNNRGQVTTFQFEQFIAWSDEIGAAPAKKLPEQGSKSDADPRTATTKPTL